MISPCRLATGALFLLPWIPVCNSRAEGPGARSLPSGASLPFVFVPSAESGYVGFGGGLQAHFRAREIRIDSAAGTIYVRFPGASPGTWIESAEPARARVHLLTNERRSNHAAAFLGVRYRNLYPGIDLLYRAAGFSLKSEFIVAPGADPAVIRMTYLGEGGRTLPVVVGADGTLRVTTPRGEYREEGLRLYQGSGHGRTVDGRFRIGDGGKSVGFEVGPYNHGQPIIIDPVLSFSTYLGGSRFDAANAVAVDPAGNIYVTGWTESYDMPAPGGFQAANAGGVDAFVAKLDPAGSTILYCTYLGGSGDDRGQGIAVDGAGNAFVTGWTTSTNFPVTSGAAQRSAGGGRDAFVAKISPAGDRLIYATYLGGSGYDAGRGIALDTFGNAYVAGETASANFPLVHALAGSSGAQQDAFIAKLDATGGTLLFSTRFGGSGTDTAAAIALDAAGNAYITGSTDSVDFPLLNPLQATNQGGQDAFVAKLNPAAASLSYSTYLGGSGGTAGLPEAGFGIGVDGAGNAYVTGATSSSNFPILNAYQSALSGATDAFVAKLNPAGNALVYSTYLGGSNSDLGLALGVDASGSACVAGQTTSQNYPVSSPIQAANAGGMDAFLTCLSPGGGALTWSTLLGGSGADAANGLAIFGSSVYLVGQTTSGDFPLAGALQNLNGGGYGGFVAKFQAASSSSLQFYSLPPCRVADTRSLGGKTGALGPPSMPAGTARTFPVGASGCGIPASAIAYSLNITAVPTAGYLGYLTAWPTGQALPIASTLNAWDGMITAGAAIVSAGAGGSINIYVSDPTDVFVDIDGYFAAPVQAGLQFYPVTPCRVADTRVFGGKTAEFGPPSMPAKSTRTFAVPSSGCGIPAWAAAYSLNITALPLTGYLCYLTAWPAGQGAPSVSTLNSWDGAITANAALIPAGAGGAISIYVSDPADVFFDINGYFGAQAAGLRLYPVTPCRVADTRALGGKTGAFGPPSIPGRTLRTFPITSAGCGIPSTAAAYSLKIGAVPITSYLGYLTSWPAGQPMPVASTLNSWNGTMTSNAALVPAGTAGSINVYVSDPTDVFIDVDGYFAP